MFTTIDKALVALIMGLLSIGNLWFGFDLGITPDALTSVIALLTPVLVWFFPNKTA